MLPRLLRTAGSLEESVVLSRDFPGNLRYEFVPPMDFGAGKAYKLVIAEDPNQNSNHWSISCARRSDFKWKAIDLSPDVIGQVCKDGRLLLDFESLESPVPHRATETSEDEHRALANQGEFPPSRAKGKSSRRPSRSRQCCMFQSLGRRPLTPESFQSFLGMEGFRPCVAFKVEGRDAVAVLVHLHPRQPRKSGQIGICLPRRTSFFHLLPRSPGRHAGEDGRESALSDWWLYWPYSLETQDGCHPEDVEVHVMRKGRPIAPEDVRVFQRDG